MKSTIENTFQMFAPYKMVLQCICAIIVVWVSLMEFNMRISMLLPATFTGIISVILFLFTKDLHKDGMTADAATKQKKHQLYLTVLTVTFWAWELADYFSLKSPFSFMQTLSLLCLFLFACLGVYICASKEVSSNIIEWNPYLHEKMPELEPGDVVIGNELDLDSKKPTGKKVIEYYKDRFVHTLVLGATGTGKTSQILGPMSYQDLQNPEMGVIVIDPKGDFAEQCYARAKLLGRKSVTYFNPVLPNCPYFNPLMCTDEGEPEMIENVVSAFQALDTTSSSYFRDQNEILLRHSITAVKRLKKNDATLNDVLVLMNNVNQQGEYWINDLHALKDPDPFVMKDNDQIYSYFTREYFPGLKGAKGAPKTFADSSAVRNQLQKLVSNPYLNRVLNPKKTSELKPGEYLDFDRVLANGEVLCTCSAQGALREMGRYLGFFLILSLQSSIFRRPGNEDTRRGCALYIDEFQTYANDSMEDLLTQGRSYKVACVFATQNRALINSGGDKGKRFQETVTSNMRNIILFPGMSADDAKYYSNTFGTKKEIVESTSTTNRAYVPKWMGFDSARQSVSQREEEVPLFPESELIYQEFGRVIVRVVDHNSIKKPVLTQINFVDRAIDKQSKHFLDELQGDRTAAEKKAETVSKRVEREVDRQIRISNMAESNYEADDTDSITLFDDDQRHADDTSSDNTDDTPIEEEERKSTRDDSDDTVNRVDQDIEDDEEEIDKEF